MTTGHNDGREWRGWWPGRRRDRKAGTDSNRWADGLDVGCVPDELGVLVAIIAIVLVALLVWFLVLPVVGWRASNTKLSEIVHDIRTTGTPTPR